MRQIIFVWVLFIQGGISMKRSLAALLSVSLLVAVAGCGGQSSTSGEKVHLKLASISPLSGGQSSLGTSISNGMKLAIEDSKDELAKAGYILEAFPQDDQADPTQGPTIANRLVSDATVIGAVGTLNSGVAKTIVQVLMDANVVMISPANTAVVLTEKGYTNYNRIVARDDFQGPAAARATLNTVKAKSVYVLHDKTEYGQGLAVEYVKEAKKINLKVVNGDGEGLNPKDVDFGALVTKIIAAKPDAIFYGGIYDTASLLFKQADEKGFKGFFIGADGLDDSKIVKDSGGAANRVYYTSVADNVYGSTEGKAFVDRYKKLTGSSDVATYAVYGYDAAKVAINALIEFGKKNNGKAPTRKQMSDAVRATKGLKGLAGDVTFDAKGDNPGAKVYLFQVKNATYPGASLGDIKK
jgi:branched-chain amino acid transport system substrate-binding protein